MEQRAREVIRLCRKLAQFTEEPGHVTRTFLSPPMRDVHRELASRMERLDMAVSVDEYIHQVGRAAGNESSGNSGFSSGWAITFINEVR